MDFEKIHNKLDTLSTKSNSKTIIVIILVVIIISGYLFFFCSTKIIGEKFDFEVSELGTVFEMEKGHTVQIVRADLDKSINTVELEFYFLNTNYDNCDDYQITIKSTTEKGRISVLESQVICSDSDMYIIRSQLPKSWCAIVADISVENDENELLQAKFYQTDDSLYETKLSEDTSREYFLKLNLQRNIEVLQEHIAELENENAELERKISEIDKNIQTTEERLKYMTFRELEVAQQNLSNMVTEKNNELAEIQRNTIAIQEYEQRINVLKNQLSGD